MGYNPVELEVRKTGAYERWFKRLRDEKAKSRINVRIRRLQLGNPGDVEPVGEGVCEMKFHFGPGYRVYYVNRETEVVVLLAGGDKSTQDKDIPKAIKLARNL